MANTIKMTSPDGTASKNVKPTTINYDGTIGETSNFSMKFEVDWDVFVDETDVDNVCQVNSLVEWTRGSQTRTFFVLSRELIQTANGAKYINVACVDPLGKLNKTIASIDGNPFFTKSSPPLDIDKAELVEIDADMGDVKWRFYPVRGNTAWLHHNLSNSSTLSATINDSDTTIILSDEHSGIAPIGYVQIDDEWIQYDGYDFGETTADSEYRIKNCFRGALSSIAATHTGTTIVYQRISQRIHPAKAILVEGSGTNDWEYLDAETFAVQVEEGAIDFNYDVSAYGNPKWNAFRATYAVFDENHANTVKLSDIFSSTLMETVANGGPAINSSSLDFDGLEDIRLTRVKIDKLTNTYDFMTNLLDEIGLMKGSDQDYIGLWYNHTDKLYTCKPIEQLSTPDYYFSNMTHVEREISLEDLYSAVMVEYEAGYNDNLVTYDRMWHPQVGESCGSNSETVAHIRYSDDLYQNFASTWIDTAGAGHNNFTDRLIDGQPDTGWGLAFTSNPGSGVNGLWCYFSNPATAYTVDSIKVVCDFRRNSGNTDPIHFKVMGVENFDIVDPSGSTGIVDISGNLVKLFEKDKNTMGFPVVEMEATKIGQELEGIVLRWEGLPTGDSASDRYCMVRELKVLGHKTKTVLVSLTDDWTLGSKFMYTRLSYPKLLDANLGQPRVKTLKIGASTYNAAISLGRLQLLQTLLYDQTRLYTNNKSFTDIPELGKTVTMRDNDGDYTGVVLAEEYSYGNGESETLNLRVIDFSAGLIS